MSNVLSVTGLSAGYGKEYVINDISFELGIGEVCAVIGRNGSGKTTLIRAICSLTKHTGYVRVSGSVISSLSHAERAGLISYLPSRCLISVPMSCRELIMTGMYPSLGPFSRIGESEIKRADTLLSDFAISELAERDFLTLSTGQRQLVLLARALLRGTPLTVLDEPDGALDFEYRAFLMDYLKAHAIKCGGAVLMCSHDIDGMLAFADRILVLSDGRITADIIPSEADEDSLKASLSPLTGDADIILHNGHYIIDRKQTK